MNFEESNSFVEEMEKNNKNKKTVLVVLVICAVLIVLLLGLISYLKYQDSLKLKMFIDDTQVPITSTLLLQDNETNYINIKELSNMLNYSYKKGEYKSYTEDENSCTLTTPYEIVSITADSETLTKYIKNENGVSNSQDKSTTANENTVVNNQLITVDETTGEQSINIVVELEDETPETFTINEPIKYINNELYISFAELPRIFNVSLDLSQKNRIRIYSLNYLIGSATQIATQLGYSEVSNTYENLTAMVDNMMVVGDGTNYGVISLQDGKEIISLKYEKMVYMQNTEEFLVTAENSVGIISKDGNTIVKPTEYDTISNLDEFNKLYLVEKDGKYGVVNGEGDTIVYAEYDEIGIKDEEEFQNEDIRNFSLLFDKCIPVEANGKMGVIDIEGNEKLKCVYDSLGYIASSSTTSDKKENTTTNNNDNDEEEETMNTSNTTNNSTVELNDYDSVLTIPESVGIKGIVINLNGLYGIYDAEAGRLIIPCACSKIYSRTKSGVTTYYLEYNEQEIELESYLEANNLKSITESNQENETEEAVENEIENQEETQE